MLPYPRMVQTYQTNVSSGENKRRASNTDKGNFPNEHQTKNTARNDGSDTLQNGAKSDTSETVNLLRVVAELRGQRASLCNIISAVAQTKGQ